MEEKNIVPGAVGTVTLSAEDFRDLIRAEAEANARAKLAEEKHSALLSETTSETSATTRQPNISPASL